MTHWQLERGATVLDGMTYFSVWAPDAREVALSLVMGGRRKQLPMERDESGTHELVLTDLEPGVDYFYQLDGERDRPDPVSRHQPRGVHGPSRTVDPRAYRWSDSDWRGVQTADLILYELHVGTFTGEGTFAAVIDRLPYLRRLGITALELMPVAEFPGRRNWGYDGVHLFAPHSGYGGPEPLRQLVDAAHAEGLAVILDVVYNHLGPEGNYLGEFGPYFTDRYHTPWGRAVNYDGPQSDEVRRYVIDNALYWITEYHLDGLRLDAVHAIFDFGALHILQELAGRVHAEGRALGRRVHVVAESDLNDPRLVRSRAMAGYGLDAQWCDDYHHAVHAALTGERSGYYADFGRIEHLAKAMRQRFVLDGVYSAYRKRRHGAPADGVPAERFVVFMQNHDQVGNRARGDRLSNLVPFEAQKLAAALLLLSPYIPLLFMGEEHGETNPFLYFVSHGEAELIEAVREGRRREFAAFGDAEGLQDPQAVTTFERSRIQWDWESEPQRRELYAVYETLLRLRREEPALRPGAARVMVDEDEREGWISATYTARGARAVVAAFNLSSLPSAAAIPACDGAWRLRFFTGDPRFGGPGPLTATLRAADGANTLRLALPPYAGALYRAETV